MRAALLVALALLGCQAHEAVSAGAAGPKVVAVVESAPPPDAGVSLELPPPPSFDAPKRKLDFHGGNPVIPVKLMEGASEVVFSSKSRLKITLPGKITKTVDVAPQQAWTAKIRDGEPAKITARVQLVEFAFNDKQGLADAQVEWERKGYKLKAQVLGGVYGVSGKVIDNRRYLLLIDDPLDPKDAAARQAQLLEKEGVRTTLYEEVREPPHGTVELFDSEGGLIGSGTDQLEIESYDGSAIDVRQVEFNVGYDNHGNEDRSYRGGLQLTADRNGKLAVVNTVGLEDLLKGLVPSEIFAKAHPEALKAQAVTARGEVLAKIGLKHLADPYLLCSEQHCAVYKGVSGEAASTNTAVDATRGEAIFDEAGKLVDSVYSAVCGGHTENNEVVWGGVPNPSLRGRPDVLEESDATVTPAKLHEFLTSDQKHMCKLSSFAQPTKYRWEKKLTAKDVDEKTASLGIGTVYAITVMDRGVSGRARLLNLSGEKGATQVRGELVIRRLFGNLNSAMFEVRSEKDPKGRPTSWIFTGGGWGHGVGLCQTGAIGRAEAGQLYRQILAHYFNGATVFRVY